MDFIDGTGLWTIGQGVVAPPTPPDEGVSHSPHDYRTAWRTADPRLRKLLLRGILPEELATTDATEIDQIIQLLDDLDDLDDLPA